MLRIYYSETNETLCTVITNHVMSVDECLELCGYEEVADQYGWHFDNYWCHLGDKNNTHYDPRFICMEIVDEDCTEEK